MPHDESTDVYNPKAGRLGAATSLWRHLRRLEKEGYGPALQQLRDIVRLKVQNGIGASYYMKAGLFRREFTWEQKRAFIGSARFLELTGRICPVETRHAFRNKIMVQALLETFRIPRPRFFGVVDRVNGVTKDGKPLKTPDDFLRMIDRAGVDQMCFKYVAGSGGKGFYKTTIIRDRGTPIVKIEPEGPEVPLGEFWQQILDSPHYAGYFCEGVVEQHPEVARFNPWSLNSVRMMMFQDEDREWQMHVAALRMGNGKIAVDNRGAGGLVSVVDIETGRLAPCYAYGFDKPIYGTHPVTSVQFAGETLPSWPEAVELSYRAARLCPSVRLAGVDIVFSTDGPLISEVGAHPGNAEMDFGAGLRPLIERLARMPSP